MPMARSKILIHDDIIQPRPQINLHFTGINLENIYKEIPKLVSAVFRMPSGSMQEKNIQFTKGESDKINISWEGFKELDKLSFYQIEVDLKGSSAKGSGTANVVIKAGLRTEYPQDTYWERSLLYEVLRMFWHSTFYHSKREYWLKDGRRLISVLVEEIKKTAHEQ